jgi:hypothetical protein
MLPWLMTFHAAQLRRTSALTDRILKGARPADLPVEEPTQFSFHINLRTRQKRSASKSRRRCSPAPMR